MNITTGRALTVVGCAVVILSLCAVMIAEVLAGGPGALPNVAGLAAFLGTLVSIFITLLKIDNVQQKINGHLQAHIDSAVEVTKKVNGLPADAPPAPGEIKTG